MRRLTLILALLASVLTAGLASANTTRFYPNASCASPGASSLQCSSVDLLRFLVNDCDGTAYDCQSGAATVGPGWTIVEASDGAAGREVPGTATDVDSLTGAAADWAGDGSGLATSSWFVVESADSTNENGTNHMQVVVEYDSTTLWKFKMCPLADWVTGAAGCGGGGCTPDNTPATCVGEGSSLVTLGTDTATAKMSLVATEAALFLLRDAAASDYIYIGEMIGTHLNATTPDTRAYVITDATSIIYPATSVQINRLSPFDDSTRIVSGYFAIPENAGFPWWGATGIGGKLGEWTIAPMSVYFSDTSHQHFTGYFPILYVAHEDLALAGTLASQTYMYVGSGSTQPKFVVPWDGSAYP